MFGCFGGTAGASRPIRRSLTAPSGSRSNGTVAEDLQSASLRAEFNHPAAAALRSGKLAITFSGGGFLLPYFIGVTEILQHIRVLSPSHPIPIAGSSAGSLIAASIACGLSASQIYDTFLDSVRDCRKHGSYKRLHTVLTRQLESTLPHDAAERCNGVATIAITRMFPRPRTKRLTSFTSRADLISALLTSCHIPAYFNGELTTSFRGKTALDGGVSSLMPVPVAPHDFLLKVCCFPRAQVARLPIFNRRRTLHHLELGITPDAFGTWPYSLKDMLTAALHPHSDVFISTLLEAGRSDATRWAHSAGLAPTDLPLRPRPPMPPLVISRTGATPAPPAAAAAAAVTVSPAEAESEIAAEAAAAASLAAPLAASHSGLADGGREGSGAGAGRHDMDAVVAEALSRVPSTAAEALAAAEVAAGTEAAQELLLQLKAHPQPEPRDEPATPQHASHPHHHQVSYHRLHPPAPAVHAQEQEQQQQQRPAYETSLSWLPSSASTSSSASSAAAVTAASAGAGETADLSRPSMDSVSEDLECGAEGERKPPASHSQLCPELCSGGGGSMGKGGGQEVGKHGGSQGCGDGGMGCGVGSRPVVANATCNGTAGVGAVPRRNTRS